MAKRFLDTAFFDDSWIMDLKPSEKLFFIYLITNCDHAGIIDFSVKLAEFKTGLKGLATVIKEFGNKVIPVKDNYYFIPAFIRYQYSNGLNPNVKAHASVIRRLYAFGLYDEENQTVRQQLGNSLVTVQDKDKDKDKDKYKDNIEYCISEWNRLADKRPQLSQKKKIGKALKKHIDARMKEHPDIEEWKELFAKISDSKVLGINSDTSWFTFDCIFTVQKRFDDIMNGWMEWKSETHKSKMSEEDYIKAQELENNRLAEKFLNGYDRKNN